MSLEPQRLPDALDTLAQVGKILDVPGIAADRVRELEERLASVRAAVAGEHRPRVAAIEWLDPLWPAGHWVPEQIHTAGGEPLLASPGEHTGPTTAEALATARPDVILLMPCGFSPERTRAEAKPEDWAGRAGQVWILDGPAYFNRPGPRVVREQRSSPTSCTASPSAIPSTTARHTAWPEQSPHRRSDLGSPRSASARTASTIIVFLPPWSGPLSPR